MKNKLPVSAALLSLTVLAPVIGHSQAIGDVTGSASYSALDTYINNYPINAYHYDGSQLIFAEDLRDYGFSVIWDGENRSLYIERDPGITTIFGQQDISRQYFLQGKKAYDLLLSDIKVYLNNELIDCYAANGKTLIRLRSLEAVGLCEYDEESRSSKVFIADLPCAEYKAIPVKYDQKLTVVLDPGHGKSSWKMTDEEKINEGYDKYNGKWGVWRHWKTGTADIPCSGSDCNHDKSCFYPIGNSDREAEVDINLQNALYAKWYLENELGYNVRMTRTSNDENPSITKRVSYCYPNNDMTAIPDAACFICIHSNSGSGKGSAYIAASGYYTQKWIKSNYISESNRLGQCINSRITAETPLTSYKDGVINDQGYLVVFNKCPVNAGYIEIGFMNNKTDLNILNTKHNEIGKAIAFGVNDFMVTKGAASK